ncbi:MAG: MATE family efflux transporter [Lachnospiraceae bacterium]|nr:MATE family efflux transporter [Lachnospiraceae bacterium]
MEQKSNLKEFLQYTIMNIIGMIGLSCYILADTFFVSKGLGSEGLAALNIAIPVYSFIHGSGLMIGMGGATKYSILKGHNESEEVKKMFTNTLYLAGIMAAMFFLLGCFQAGNIAEILGADSNVHAMTETYLKILMLFAPVFLLNDILICFIRNDGNPKLSMSAMLVGSLANIILDYIFIFPMGMGIFGAVFATGLAPVISLIILSSHFFNKKNQFTCGKVKLHGAYIKNILGIGFPSFISEVASGIVIIIFNIIILKLRGNIGVAAYGVIANIALVAVAIHTGVAQGMQPLVSRAYGRGKIHIARTIYRYAIITVIIVSAFTYSLIFGMSENIVKAFNSEQNLQMQQIATIGLKLYFISIPFIGYNIVTAMFFSAVERPLSGQAIAILRGILLTIPIAVLLSYLFGLYGVWITVPVTEGIVAVAAAGFWIKYLRRKR